MKNLDVVQNTIQKSVRNVALISLQTGTSITVMSLEYHRKRLHPHKQCKRLISQMQRNAMVQNNVLARLPHRKSYVRVKSLRSEQRLSAPLWRLNRGQNQTTRQPVNLFVSVSLSSTAIWLLAHRSSVDSTWILDVEKRRLPDRGRFTSPSENSEAVRSRRFLEVYNRNMIRLRGQLNVQCATSVVQYASTFTRFLEP